MDRSEVARPKRFELLTEIRGLLSRGGCRCPDATRILKRHSRTAMHRGKTPHPPCKRHAGCEVTPYMRASLRNRRARKKEVASAGRSVPVISPTRTPVSNEALGAVNATTNIATTTPSTIQENIAAPLTKGRLATRLISAPTA